MPTQPDSAIHLVRRRVRLLLAPFALAVAAAELLTPTIAGAGPVPTPAATVTSTPIATPTSTPIAATDLNHFLCYDLHRPATQRTAGLDDVFGDSDVAVRRPKRICAPADKADEDPTAPQDPDHLTGYTIRQTSPRFEEREDQIIINQFGTLVADLVRPEMLLVPTGKAVGPQPPADYMAGIDHFKCYRTVRARFRESGIAVEDQFGPLTVDVKRPSRFCAVADKNDEGVIDDDPTTGLMCYRIRARERQVVHEIATRNQFGTDTYEFLGVRELCVPSRLTCDATMDCDDGNACTTDSCSGGTCVHSPVNCDDGVLCTADTCDPSVGCRHVASDCNDGFGCTIDRCDLTLGHCVHEDFICPPPVEECAIVVCIVDTCEYDSSLCEP